MKMHLKTLRFNYNPLNLILNAKRKQGLRIGYMQAILENFCLNSIETGVPQQEVIKLLANKFNCIDSNSTYSLLEFLINEGDRISYAIQTPFLLSTDNLNEFEKIIRDRFFGVERFVQQGKNLYNFVKYAEERRDPIIWLNDLERGIIGCDMGLLVTIARAAHESGYISREEAWEYIEQANTLCNDILHTPEEVDKSCLIGRAIKSDRIEDWEQLILCYSLLKKYRK
ncbi:DUF1266 domain-containing protein [Bacteroides sp.]|uniref:DUF1266 domain-containing protein n=1 Tax=Bacteroides sp. TaxID=29523 RepID=UPI00262764CB|nr:DUF1266 domain-containing protein [Bacteroides sp.]MDD3036431.1 DUF1266 domain-containing protein [Bacteroides sp.]